jgi:hypothetical protein
MYDRSGSNVQPMESGAYCASVLLPPMQDATDTTMRRQ